MAASLLGSLLGVPRPASATDPTSPPFLSEGRSVPERTGSVAAAALPAGFSDNLAFGGLDQPTAVAFAPDGRVFVTEKPGRLVVFGGIGDTTKSTVIDLQTEVNDFWDRGLSGIALSPTFASDGWIYLLYTFDRLPGDTVVPRWGEVCPDPPGVTRDGCVVTGRLIRIKVSAANLVVDRDDLITGEWCQQFPSHSQDDLAFGPDGFLYVSSGEGANFNATDYGQFGGSPGSPTPVNPCADPLDYGGGLRAQSPRRPTGAPRLLNGSILRVDPATGNGAPGNPFAASSDANARRIAAYGLRNPYRIGFRPGTAELWIADVGWDMNEEINRFTVGTATAPNFGWPCFEGATQRNAYQSHAGCGLDYADVTPAFYSYPHAGSGAAVSGLAFYNGGAYPDGYDGALFFADYVRNWIKVMLPGTGGVPSPANVVDFQAASAVDLAVGPGGDLFYVDFFANVIRRISYGAPTARATATPTYGPTPLSVHLDGSGSTSPLGLTLSYDWDLDGDGAFDDASGAVLDHVFSSPGTIDLRLRVTDTAGASAVSAPLRVSPGEEPPQASITSVRVATTTYAPPPSFMTATPPSNGIAGTSARVWAVGNQVQVTATASDAQDGTLPGTSLTWDLTLHHCQGICHAHQLQTASGSTYTFVAPDHEWPSYLSVRLTARDSAGLTATASVNLYPRSSTISLTSSPGGATLLVDGTSASLTRIVGHTGALSASAEFTSDGRRYRFSAWSDGVASASRAVTFAAADRALVAGYVEVPTVNRLAGADRYATAAMISAATYPAGVPVAYVATGRDFPDALAGAAAATRRGGPVLLVPGTSLPSVVRGELDRLNPTQIVVLGGTAVVSAAVVDQLAPLAGSGGVIRRAGADRYATAVSVSQNAFPAGVPVAYVASGRGYPDALAAAAAAGVRGGPVLLVPGTSLPSLVRAELDRLNPTRIVVVGGPAVVSEAVRSALVPLAGSGGVVRRYGADRYATALAISQDAFPSGASWVHVATGRDFPDALAGAAAAGRRGGPMLLVLPATLPAGVPAELRRLRAPRITVLGGAGAVSSGVEAQLGAPY